MKGFMQKLVNTVAVIATAPLTLPLTLADSIKNQWKNEPQTNQQKQLNNTKKEEAK